MGSRSTQAFDVLAFLASAGIARKIVEYRRSAIIFSQGDACGSVMYVQRGGVKLSVRSNTGREAVVAMLGPGEFFGEGSLAGQRARTGSATAITLSTILVIEKHTMVRLLHQQHAVSDRFIAHMLARNTRVEEDLIDQLFNSSEERLARALLVLACYGRGRPRRILPKISQKTLADMVGTTRERVNFFMNKFTRLGFIEQNGKLKINRSLLSVVLHE